MKKLFFAWGAILLGFSAFAQNTPALLSNYIAVKDALVSSDAQAATEAIAVFYRSVAENVAQKDELVKAAEKLNKANGLEKQRGSFNDVSVAMWKLVKESGKINGPVYYQYCPMKKAWWLSKEKEIRNPYYGSSMLSCGKVAETRP